MTYAIVLFADADRNFAAEGLYLLNGHASRDVPEVYVTDDFASICDTTDKAAYDFSRGSHARRHYAVFSLHQMSAFDARQGTLTGFDASNSAPLYVPSDCAPLLAFYGWNAKFNTQLGQARRIVPGLPLVFDDGSPAPVSGEMSGSVRVVHPNGDGLWHSCMDGHCVGLTHERPSVRVAPISASLAATAAATLATPAAPEVRFEVRSGLNGTDRDTWGTVAEFDNGKDAGAWVGSHKSDYAEAGKSLVIVKVELEAQTVDWRARERQRLIDGTYAPLPGDWAEKIAYSYPDHFAHVSQSDKRKIAFTESESSGERDRQKVLSASAYVERYFDGDGAAWWGSRTRGEFIGAMLGDSVQPLITPLGDADAMEMVYRETQGTEAGGCMSYRASDFSGSMHPVRVYAMGGELSVAFLRAYGDDAPEGESRRALNPDATWDGEGPILARCLVWIKDGENKEFGRVYGRTDDVRMLRTALEARGFKAGDCIGARIAKVESHGEYVMPYLDIGCGYVTDHGDYFTAGGDLSAQRTDGLMSCDEMETCEYCEGDAPESAMRDVLIGGGESQRWCEGCRDYHTFYCDHLGESVHDDYRAEYRPSGSIWSQSVAEWLLYDGTLDGVLVDADGVYYEDGATCEDCSEGVAPDDVRVWDGRDTGDAFQSEGDALCTCCHDERESAADELAEAEANETENVASEAA